MLKYLIVLLDDTSVAYCHCDNSFSERRLMPLDTLREAIFFGMKENLNIQFVWPDYELPEEYLKAIDSIDHVNIVPANLAEESDVVVYDRISTKVAKGATIVIRTRFEDLLKADLSETLKTAARVNVVVTDVENLDEERYAAWLETLTEEVRNHPVQLNLLTDRAQLTEMNNCNAGWESVTVAPDGNFYVCPAFYYCGDKPVGSLREGLDIKNPQLYRLDHAPICRNCDAWQCRRCVWLNRRMTLEVNTPSREQCVMAHLERNASRRLNPEIPEIDYLDPFDKIEK